MTIQIRRAVPTDAPAIIALQAERDDVRAPAEYIAAYLADATQLERVYVAEVDGRIAGMASLQVSPRACDPVPEAELTEIIVGQAFRRRGVGRALLARAEAEAKAQGAVELVLMTAWRNGEAHAFYHALGYRLYTVMMKKGLRATK